jgi:transcriptional regulator with XRE-family HTH domain
MLTLPARLNEIIKSVGLTQKDLASILRVAIPTVNQWLNEDNHGNSKEPCGLPHLARIVDEVMKGSADEKEMAFLGLVILLDRERVRDGSGKWTESSRQFALDMLEREYVRLKGSSVQTTKRTGRTLCDFPHSMYPLAIVSGDKREESESRINVGDFGAVSASPAEARWLLKLGLRSDVQLFGDKVFMVEEPAELKTRFGKCNLLVVGSPGSNHLARRLHLSGPTPGWRKALPVFRFNLHQHILQEIEKFLGELSDMNSLQLMGVQGDPHAKRQLKNWLHKLFGGGIIDPTNKGHWERATEVPPNRDYGLVSLGPNPFSDDDQHVCISAAGLHMFGTAHALRMLSNPDNFKAHPYGGVIRVDMTQQQKFAKRFDESRAEWDSDSDYTRDELLQRLEVMRQQQRPHINVTDEEIDDSIQFVNAL